jgi:hypothetical protein
MGTKMRLRSLAFAVLGLAAGAGGAYADTFTTDTTLTNPPGVYFGAGNSNAGFTVDRSGSFELGLSAINRFIGPITPTGFTYDVPTGATTVPGKTGAEWGFIFSVNNNYNGTTTDANAAIGNFNYNLSLQDIGLGTSASGFDPSFIGDNSKNAAGTAFQNSETLSFASIAAVLGDPGYNLNANDTYIFTLSVLDKATSAVLASDHITVVAGTGAPTSVPEPLTLSLFAAGLLGAGALRRRKSSKQI